MNQRIVCALSAPIAHHPGCEPNDCYCDVWCKHGRLECDECPGFTIEEGKPL